VFLKALDKAKHLKATVIFLDNDFKLSKLELKFLALKWAYAQKISKDFE